MNKTIDQLARQAKASGSSHDLGVLLMASRRKLTRIILSMASPSICSCREAAEDLAGEAMEKHLLRSWPKWRPESCSYATVINRAARHTTAKAVRHLMAKGRHLEHHSFSLALKSSGYIVPDMHALLAGDDEALLVFNLSFILGHTVKRTVELSGLSMRKVRLARVKIRKAGQYLREGSES